MLAPGPAFVLVKKLLRLNRPDKQYVEVILLSRNSADTGLARVQLDQALRPRHHARGVHQGRADVALRAGVRRASVPVGRSGRRAPRAGRGPRGRDDLPERGRHERDRRAADRVRRRRRALFGRGRARLSGRTASPRSRKSESRCRARAARRRAVQGISRRAASDPGRFPGGQEPDPHRARHRAQRARARARDPHAARMEHPDRRGAVPRRARQGRVPARVPRRHLLRRPAHARGIRAEARRGRATCRTASPTKRSCRPVERAGQSRSRSPIGATPSRSITRRCARSRHRRPGGGGAVSRGARDA